MFYTSLLEKKQKERQSEQLINVQKRTEPLTSNQENKN